MVIVLHRESFKKSEDFEAMALRLKFYENETVKKNLSSIKQCTKIAVVLNKGSIMFGLSKPEKKTPKEVKT